MEDNGSEFDNDISPLVRRGDHESRSSLSRTSSGSMWPVIVIVMLERLTYYSVLANLLLFFKYDVFNEYQDNATQPRTSNNASKSVLILVGFSWLMCVTGGWLSDAKFGKLRTLIIGLVFYAVGMGLLFGVACIFKYKHDWIHVHEDTLYRGLLVFPCFVICLIGEGAYKANISPFGAEQLSRQDEISTRRFFNYYYFSLNIGAFFAFSGVAYVQQKYGFVYGFGIPLGAISLALVILVCKRHSYRSVASQRILGKVWQIVSNARKNRGRNWSVSPRLMNPAESWLDYAKLKHGGSFLDWEVDEVKLLTRVLPVFFVLIPYWAIYSQMQATFLEQGIRMKIYNMNSFSIPAAWLNIINVTVVVILIPVMEKIVYPYLTKRGYRNSPITRITFGILMACLSIIAAAFVEIYVIQDLKEHKVKNHTIDEHTVIATKISVFWQIPQYMLIGISEVFAVVAGLEFAYLNAPKSLQSIVMAFYFVTHSLGSLLGYALLELSEQCHIISEKRYYGYSNYTNYYYLLCVLTLISWFVFIAYINRSDYGDKKNSRLKRLNNRFFGNSDVNEEENSSPG